MKRKWLTRAVVLLAIAGAAFVVGLFASGLVQEWTQRKVLAGLETRISAASEEEAVRLIDDLGNSDVAAVPLLVRLLADDRKPVAHAAQREIDQLLDAWQQLPGGEAARRCNTLAHHLAAGAQCMPASSQTAARHIAVRMLARPPHPEAAGDHQLISDCETILRLTATDATEPEIALAGLPAFPEEETTEKPIVPHYQLSDDVAQPETTAEATPPALEPPPGPPVEPQRLPDAPVEEPTEPRRFLAPRAMRIEG